VALPGAYAPTSIVLLIIGASKLRLHNKLVVLEKDEGIQEIIISDKDIRNIYECEICCITWKEHGVILLMLHFNSFIVHFCFDALLVRFGLKVKLTIFLQIFPCVEASRNNEF
jgi:hypothetical protein